MEVEVYSNGMIKSQRRRLNNKHGLDHDLISGYNLKVNIFNHFQNLLKN